MSDLEEIATREISKRQKPYGLEYKKVVRDDIEKNFGKNVVTKNNKLNYEYKNEKLMINRY